MFLFLYRHCNSRYDIKKLTDYYIIQVTTETCDRLSKMSSDTHIPLMKTMFTAAIKANALVSYGTAFNDDSHVNRLWRAYDGVCMVYRVTVLAGFMCFPR